MSFPIPRPRGKDMPSAKPLRKTTNTSSNSAFGSVKTLDRLGRQTVSLAPRTKGGITIESREQSGRHRWPRRSGSRGRRHELASLRSRKARMDCCKPWHYA